MCSISKILDRFRYTIFRFFYQWYPLPRVGLFILFDNKISSISFLNQNHFLTGEKKIETHLCAKLFKNIISLAKCYYFKIKKLTVVFREKLKKVRGEICFWAAMAAPYILKSKIVTQCFLLLSKSKPIMWQCTCKFKYLNFSNTQFIWNNLYEV